MDTIKILGIVGSLRKASYNHAQQFDPHGALTDAPARQLIQKLMIALAALARNTTTQGA